MIEQGGMLVLGHAKSQWLKHLSYSCKLKMTMISPSITIKVQIFLWIALDTVRIVQNEPQYIHKLKFTISSNKVERMKCLIHCAFE